MVPLKKDAPVIGLTGSFGSGCSSLREVLEASKFEGKEKGFTFKGFSLSLFVKQKWLEQNWGKFNPNKPLASATEQECNDTLKKARRYELQVVGDIIRENQGHDKLAKLAIEKAAKETSNIAEEISLVFDNIRNTGEIKALRENFPNFYLIAVDCPKEERWRRVRDIYENHGQTETDFEKDDERDRGEDTPYGQQVELCIDDADIMMKNDENYSEKGFRMMKMEEKVRNHIDVLSGNKLRIPEDDEFFMSLAYTASLNSRCFKRQVGAVIVDKEKNVLSVGYNENVQPHQPCVNDPGDCQRDIYKRGYFQKLADEKTAVCPKCRKTLNYSLEFKCRNKLDEYSNCNYKLDEYFIPDKALSRCTALHAEARALRTLRGGELRKGSILYTTASPCLTCSVEIINVGIKKVVFSEAYTDTKAMDFLKKEGVDTRKFEGVKTHAYFKVFSSWRREKEKEIKERVESFRS